MGNPTEDGVMAISAVRQIHRDTYAAGVCDSLREFNAAVDEFANIVVPDILISFLRKMSLRALVLVVDGTPVGNPDTWKRKPPPGYVGGRARGNWQVTLNAPATSFLQRKDKTGDRTKEAGAKVLQRIRRLSEIVYISNNLPYIEALDLDQHSPQAPDGIIKPAIDILAAEARALAWAR